MPSSFTDDLIYLLEHGGLGLVYGTNVFKGPKAKLPTSDGPFVSIIRAVGQGTEGTHNSKDAPAYEQPGAQIVVRATAYDDAEIMAQRIYDLLWPVQNQFVNGCWWRQLSIKGEIFDLPVDDRGMVRVAFNLGSVKRMSASSS